MTPEQAQRLENKSSLNQRMIFKNKHGGGSRTMGTIVDEVSILVGDYKHLIQKVEFCVGMSWDESRYAYRTGYYTWDAGYRRLTWGQFTQFLTEKEYKRLLSLARAKQWDI
jgi:hypothetical protein